VCTICSRPDSKKGNEILFCDDCDAGYHQRCVGLTNIPKGDWTCPTCSKEKITSLSTPESGATVQAQAEKPDIPNFEQHLRSLQRVLLDRCTGRRRIKLIGQDEAYGKAYQLVEQTVVAGEGNSMLVMGARGCGKTTVCQSSISRLPG
jgi:origin recognition complex subunit 4